jgi:hypothetical protein
MRDHDGVEQVITMAWRAHYEPGALSRCYLSGGNDLPVGPCCAACPANLSVQAAVEAHNARQPQEAMDLRTFAQSGMIRPNRLIAARRVQQLVADYL